MSRRLCRSTLLAVALLQTELLCRVAASAQEPTLTKFSEAGFRRLMKMAETGQLGADVSAANVSISGNQVRLELSGRGTAKVILLKRRDSTQALSRFFHLEGSGATTDDDLVAIGKALDAAFGSDDPFEAATDFFGTSPGSTLPSFVAAWREDGWRGILRGVESRMTVLASLSYAVGVIVCLALGLGAGLLLLWRTDPSDL